MIDWSALGPGDGGDLLYEFANSELLQAKAFEFFAIFFLGLMRLIPIVGTVPFLGSRVLPTPVKVIEAVCLFLIFLPVVYKVTTTEIVFNEMFLLLAAKEFMIGFILGFFVSLPFTMMQSAGILIDHQRGAASMMVNDPAIQNQSSPIGLFFNLILIYLFYLVDGPFYFFEVINSSFELIPPDRFFSATLFNIKGPFWQRMLPLMNNFVALTIQFAAPSLILILMTDFFLGIANRLAPQVQIIFLGLGLKAAIPLVVLSLGWGIFIETATKETIKETLSIRDIVLEIGGLVQKNPPTPATQDGEYLPTP